jgi:hypothetical protein
MSERRTPGPLSRIVQETLARLGDELTRVPEGDVDAAYDIWAAGKTLKHAGNTLLGLVGPRKIWTLVRGKIWS